MKSYVLPGLICVLLATGAVLATPPASAWGSPFECTGVVPTGTTIAADLVVPDSATCTLEGSVTLNRNIQVGTSANLNLAAGSQANVGNSIRLQSGSRVLSDATSTLQVHGSVVGMGAYSVDLVSADIGGNVRLSGLVFGASLTNGHIAGNLDITHNVAVAISITAEKVDETVLISYNTFYGFGMAGGGSSLNGQFSTVHIRNNYLPRNLFVSGDVTENLWCAGNTPAPTDSGVTVHGTAHNQCAGF